MALIDVPLAGQTLAVTQNPIRQNFLSINNAFAIDHVVYNIANAGFHNKVTFPLQGAAPIFGGLNGLWSQLYASTGAVGEIWVNSRNGNQYPITASVLSQAPAIGDNTDGWTFLPSGILMKWGRATFAGGALVINLNLIGPAFSATFSASATSNAAFATVTVAITSLSPGNLAFAASTVALTSIYWVVYGR